MILLVDDLLRIADLGYDNFYEFRNGFYKLRNIDGKCFFLRLDKYCSIYPHRPLGCRVYPLIYIEGEGVDLDSLCPISHLLSEKDLLEHFTLIKEFFMKLKQDYGYEIDLILLERSFEQLIKKQKVHSKV